MHWDHYWDLTKALSSFGDANTALGYPEEVLNFWNEVVLEKGEDAVYLDLATGKGALAIWLQCLLKRKNLSGSVYGCDLANIDELKITSDVDEINSAINKVKFQFNTSLENLPYPNEYFDILVSQFGFEYSNWSHSLNEARRVLNKDGEIILMMHHPDSVITNDCKSGLKILNLMLENNILNELENLVALKLQGHIELFQTRNKEVIQKIQSLNISNDEEKLWFADIMSKVSKIMLNIDQTSKTKLNSLQNALRQQIERLLDQTSVAFSEDELYEKFEAAKLKNMKMSIAAFNVNNELFCWQIKISPKEM
jgi:ubiquinone/menaquinone biosynthesis C-methylase UbiE